MHLFSAHALCRFQFPHLTVIKKFKLRILGLGFRGLGFRILGLGLLKLLSPPHIQNLFRHSWPTGDAINRKFMFIYKEGVPVYAQ